MSLPEHDLCLLGEVSGRDVLEYGCGGAQWSIALARRGARMTGLDNSARQLAYAAAAVEAAGVAVTLIHAPGELMPFRDASFDIVFCDHGAMSFAAPERTIPEVARVLRPGGIFIFNVEHPLHAIACDPTADEPSRVSHHSYFGLDRCVDPADGAVSFTRPISAYLALLDAHGFALERLLEPQPGEHATTTYEGFVAWRWARDFPAELILRVRRR